MTKHKNIIELFQNSFDKRNSSTFKTSLEVIQKVMNVPMCAVKSILRSNGCNDIHDEASLCIDEERLGLFTEAYIRKMKNYFTRSFQNISSLPRKERSDFNKFVKLFKKKGVKEPKKWETDIDIEHLKDVFVENVKEETEDRNCSRSGMRFCISSEVFFKHLSVEVENTIDSCTERTLKILEGKDIDETNNLNRTIHIFKLLLKYAKDNLSLNHNLQTILHRDVLSSDIVYKEQNILKSYIQNDEGYKERKENLKSISYSEYYITKPINEKPVWCGINLISRFVSFARYYIYSVTDDDDSYGVNIEFMRNENLMFNNHRTLI